MEVTDLTGCGTSLVNSNKNNNSECASTTCTTTTNSNDSINNNYHHDNATAELDTADTGSSTLAALAASSPRSPVVVASTSASTALIPQALSDPSYYTSRPDDDIDGMAVEEMDMFDIELQREFQTDLSMQQQLQQYNETVTYGCCSNNTAPTTLAAAITVPPLAFPPTALATSTVNSSHSQCCANIHSANASRSGAPLTGRSRGDGNVSGSNLSNIAGSGYLIVPASTTATTMSGCSLALIHGPGGTRITPQGLLTPSTCYHSSSMNNNLPYMDNFPVKQFPSVAKIYPPSAVAQDRDECSRIVHHLANELRREMHMGAACGGGANATYMASTNNVTNSNGKSNTTNNSNNNYNSYNVSSNNVVNECVSGTPTIITNNNTTTTAATATAVIAPPPIFVSLEENLKLLSMFVHEVSHNYYNVWSAWPSNALAGSAHSISENSNTNNNTAGISARTHTSSVSPDTYHNTAKSSLNIRTVNDSFAPATGGSACRVSSGRNHSSGCHYQSINNGRGTIDTEVNDSLGRIQMDNHNAAAAAGSLGVMGVAGNSLVASQMQRIYEYEQRPMNPYQGGPHANPSYPTRYMYAANPMHSGLRSCNHSSSCNSYCTSGAAATGGVGGTTFMAAPQPTMVSSFMLAHTNAAGANSSRANELAGVTHHVNANVATTNVTSTATGSTRRGERGMTAATSRAGAAGMVYPRAVKPQVGAGKGRSRGPRSQTGKNVAPSNYSAFSECSGGETRSYQSTVTAFRQNVSADVTTTTNTSLCSTTFQPNVDCMGSSHVCQGVAAGVSAMSVAADSASAHMSKPNNNSVGASVAQI